MQQKYGVLTVLTPEEIKGLEDMIQKEDPNNFHEQTGRELLKKYLNFKETLRYTDVTPYDLRCMAKLADKLGEINQKMYEKEKNFSHNAACDISNRLFLGLYNEIINRRNEIVNSPASKRTPSEIQALSKSVTTMMEYCDTRNNRLPEFVASYDNVSIVKDAPKFLEHAKSFTQTLNTDQERYPEYYKQKIQARVDFDNAKQKYEQKSRLGKLIARFNGEYKKLEELGYENAKYNMRKIKDFQREERDFAELDNSAPYDKYLESSNGHGR